jgi:hypothetical protein
MRYPEKSLLNWIGEKVKGFLKNYELFLEVL